MLIAKYRQWADGLDGGLQSGWRGVGAAAERASAHIGRKGVPMWSCKTRSLWAVEWAVDGRPALLDGRLGASAAPTTLHNFNTFTFTQSQLAIRTFPRPRPIQACRAHGRHVMLRTGSPPGRGARWQWTVVNRSTSSEPWAVGNWWLVTTIGLGLVTSRWNVDNPKVLMAPSHCAEP